MLANEKILPLQPGPSRAANICATGTTEGCDRWKRYCQVLAELRAKPTAELHKMGLARTDLPRVAREAAYGRCS